MPENTLIVLTTVPDRATAEQLAEQLIEQNLAACVNIMGEMTSVYRWQGKIHQGTEHQLLIKTCLSGYPAVQTWITEHHPYELPEILAIPVAAGLPAYLDWVQECTRN